MAIHGYYFTTHWKELRRAALRRDHYRCVVEGCERRASVVDHIQTRPRVATPTDMDVLSNLRSLCPHHDIQIKEFRGGVRRRGGVPLVRGCDVEGWPRRPF